jgi:hypothetical protein
MDQPSSSKGHNKKRKVDHFVNAMERPRFNKEYWPKSGEFEGFLDRICIFTPRESTRPETVIDAKVSQMRCSRWPKGPIKRKSPKSPRVTSPKLIRRSTTSMVAPTHMSQGGSKNSQPRRSWRSHPPPPSTLNGSRSPSPSTVVNTRTLCQTRGNILS